SGELRAAHIAAVHAGAGPRTPPGNKSEERREEWETQRQQVRTDHPGVVLQGWKKPDQKERAVAAHAVGLPRIGKGLAETREFVFDPATQTGVGIDPGVTQAVGAAWDVRSGQLVADQLARWKLTKGQVKHASGLNNSRRDTKRWLAPIKPHIQHLAAASSACTSLMSHLRHITVTLATWDAAWEVHLDPKWAQQRLRLYGAENRALEHIFKKLEEDMEEVSMERHGRAKQLVVIFGAAGIALGEAACSSQAATQPAASEPGPSTPPPAKRSKRTKAEQAAKPTQPTKAKGKAAKAKPAPQPGRWLDRDCIAALNMQRIGESKWRPLELCYWPGQGALPAKGKEYPGLGYKRLQDKPPKTQPAAAQERSCTRTRGFLLSLHKSSLRWSTFPHCQSPHRVHPLTNCAHPLTKRITPMQQQTAAEVHKAESSRRGASYSDGTSADAPDGNIYVKDQHSQLHHPRHNESKVQASGKPPVHVAKDSGCQPKQDMPACTESLQLSALTLEIQQLNAKAAQRMALMHSTAKELLATVQRQGYEVASGLDALQDDLCEVEGLMLDSRRLSGAMAEASAAPVCTTLTLQRTHSPGSVSCALQSSLWPRVPKASAPIATAGSSGMHTPRPCSSLERGLSVCTPLSVSPNTERMVMLKARREHVEASFLELIKACVGGLERLVTLSDPAAAASTTVTSGGKPSQA
ncbi:hypothetical protein QJQ45_024235, partial [Haematococcus lacustris]